MRLQHLCKAYTVQVMQFLISKFQFFFDKLSCCASVGLRVFCARKLVTLEGWVILPVKSHWRMNISANFCRTAESFGWPWNNLLRSSVNSPSLITAQKYTYCSRGTINFWSHLDEERPEKPQIFHRIPSCGRVQSIKSAGQRSPQVTLITWPMFFFQTFISCRIYIREKSILHVHLLAKEPVWKICKFWPFVIFEIH